MGLFKKIGKKVKKVASKAVSKVKSAGSGFKRDVVDTGVLSKVAGVASKVVAVAGGALTATGIGSGLGGVLMGASAGLGVMAKVTEPTQETNLEAVTSVTDTDLANLTYPDLGVSFDVPSSFSSVSGGVASSASAGRAGSGAGRAGSGAGGAGLLVAGGLLWWLL